MQQIRKFHRVLSFYHNHNFTIIDFYGVEASHTPFSLVYLCDIIGILCHMNSGRDLDTLGRHQSDSQEKILEMQMVFVFVKVALQHNCTIDFSNQNNYLSRSFLRKVASEHNWGKRAPVRNIDTAPFIQSSFHIDKMLRHDYKGHFVKSNATADILQAKNLPQIQEVDEEYVFHDNIWAEEMKKMVIFALGSVNVCSRHM